MLAWLALPDSATANPLSTPEALSSQRELCLGLLLPHSPGCGWLPLPMSPDPPPLLLSCAQPWGPTFCSSLVCQCTLSSQHCFSLPACQRALDVVSQSPSPSLIFLVLNSFFSLQSPTSSTLHKPQCSGFSSSFLYADVSSPALSSLLCCNKQVQIPPGLQWLQKLNKHVPASPKPVLFHFIHILFPYTLLPHHVHLHSPAYSLDVTH